MSYKEYIFIQCTVRKTEGSSITTRTIWGNVDKAIIGNKVTIEENDGSWTGPWEIVSIHGKPMNKLIYINDGVIEENW